MKILYCGTWLPNEIAEKMRFCSPAANQYQEFFLEKLSRYVELDIISYLGWPIEEKNKEELIKIKKNNYNYFIKDKKGIRCLILFRKKLKSQISKSDVIITYNVLYSWLGINNWIKKNNKKSVLILADHTEWYEHKNIIRKILAKATEKEFKKYDVVIGLSQNIKQKLNNSQKFIVMEGGISINEFEHFKLSPQKDIVNIMYSGLLSDITGVDIFLEAIKMNNNNKLRFIITGKGPFEEKIKELEKLDSRVIYYGYVDYKEYIRLLEKSDILINPRNMNLDQNKNNFPSKIMDYLASGRIIISTKFPGYDNFEENITFIESDSKDLIKKIEQEVLNLHDNKKNVFYRNIEKAKDYDWEVQIKRLIEQI